MNREYVDRIKKALKNGGLVVAPRGVGKSAALAEILAENPNSIVIVTNDTMFRRLRDLYREHTGEELGGGRLFHVNTFTNPEPGRKPGWPFDLAGKEMYIDEYWIASGRCPEDWHGAVTSFPFPMTVIS